MFVTALERSCSGLIEQELGLPGVIGQVLERSILRRTGRRRRFGCTVEIVNASGNGNSGLIPLLWLAPCQAKIKKQKEM